MGKADGLAKQRTISSVMERIVRQEIPAAVIDNGDLLWNPGTNEVKPADASRPAAVPDGAEARRPRARHALCASSSKIFHAVRKVDPYSPNERRRYIRRAVSSATARSRRRRSRRCFISVLESDEVQAISPSRSRRKLGRPLEPFDIWYSGFKSRGRHSEAELNAIDEERSTQPRVLPGRRCRRS